MCYPRWPNIEDPFFVGSCWCLGSTLVLGNCRGCSGPWVCGEVPKTTTLCSVFLNNVKIQFQNFVLIIYKRPKKGANNVTHLNQIILGRSTLMELPSRHSLANVKSFPFFWSSQLPSLCNQVFYFLKVIVFLLFQVA